MYEKYKKLIQARIDTNTMTEEFIEKTTTQLDYYLSKKKITKKEYDELITMMNANEINL